MVTTELSETNGGQQDDHVSRTQLKIQFHSTRKGEDETIEAYVQELKSIANSLAEIGSPISDYDLVVQLLAGLTSSKYVVAKNTISSQWPLPTFSETCSILSMYEPLLIQDQTTPPPPPSMTTTTTGAKQSVSNSSSRENNSYNIPEMVEKIHDIAIMMSPVATIARVFFSKVLGSSSDLGTSKPAAGGGNNKKYNKGQAGRGRNNNKRGPAATTNFRNSGPK